MLELRGLAKRYGDTVALDGADLSAAPGRIVGFLGPNGAGKTTTMRSIFGLVELDAGETLWRGQPITDADRATFGYMPEQRGLYPKMRVKDQLVYFGELHGLDRKAATVAADRWLEEFDLTDRAGDRVDALSHGNQQRVQLSVALVHEPALLVLDEPFSGLDPVGVERMKAVVRDAAAREACVVFSSHQLDLVEDLCDDVVVVRHGQVILAGHLDDVRDADPHRRMTIGFEHPQPHWDPDLPGVEVVARRNGAVRLVVAKDVDPDLVLSQARRSGAITRFAYEPQTLNEIFLEAVSEVAQ
jgi:ABC-2 type transport system ATP-binding protein